MITPIKKKRVSEEIAEQLTELILNGTYHPGEKLPSERELSKSLEVNRISLREALKKMEQMNLITIRHGDGATVNEAGKQSGFEILRYLLASVSVDSGEILRSVFEFRAIMGAEMTRLAARRAVATDISRLEKIIAEEKSAIGDPERILKLDFDFFATIAAASGNEVMRLLLNSIKGIYIDNSGTFMPLIVSAETVVRYHEKILARLKHKDPETASAAAREYLENGLQHFFSTIK